MREDARRGGKKGCGGAAARPAAVGEDTSPRLLLYYAHGFSMGPWSTCFAEGERPEESHWGMHEARWHGFRVISTSDGASTLWRKVCGWLSFRLLRFDLPHLLHNLRLLRDCDVVWASSERELIAVLLACSLRWRRRSRPVICSEIVWLNDEWPTYSWLRRLLLRRLLTRADSLLIVTEGGAREFRRILPDVPVQAYRFGIPAQVYAAVRRTSNLGDAVSSGRPVRVLVAGNDLRRDWETVARAFGGEDRFDVVLLTRREHVAAYQAFGTNLHYVHADQLRSLLDWYAWADVAVIASQPNWHGAGLTMLLEAAAVGIPLICARTGDIDEYLPAASVSYVPPLDPEAMRDAAMALVRDPDAAARQAKLAKAAARHPALSSAAAVERRCRVLHERLRARGRVAAAAVEDQRGLAGSEIWDEKASPERGIGLEAKVGRCAPRSEA